MDNNEITVTQALNHLQSWLNAGEFDKVIQGAKEILQLEPANQRASSLLKIAEEKRFSSNEKKEPIVQSATVNAEPLIASETPKPIVTPPHLVAPSDPLIASLHVVPRSGSIDLDNSKHEKITHFLAMLIPALLVVLIGGGIIWYLSDKNREEVIQGMENQNRPVASKKYLKENEERVTDLTKIGAILEKYKIENGAFPASGQVDEVLKSSGLWNGLPTDPRNGEEDKAGNLFAYIYAVYESGDEYIISAIFEDSKGYAYPWSRGASVNEHTDYRDLESPNVHLIANDGKPSELQESAISNESAEESHPKVKVKRP